MKKLILLFVIASTAITHIKAQISIATEGGISFNTLNYNPAISSNTSFITSPRIGALLEFKISNGLSIQPGIAWSIKGGKTDLFGETITTLHYVEVPVNLVYKFRDKGLAHPFIAIGPYFSYGIGGRYKTQHFSGGDEGEYKIDWGTGIYEYKPYDIGATLSLGYELPIGLYMRAYYQKGFTNNSNDASFSRSNSGFGIMAGYFFGRKQAKHYNIIDP